MKAMFVLSLRACSCAVLSTPLLMISANAAAEIFRVDIDSTATSPDGLSWALSFDNVQDALDAAAADTSGPHQIWVADTPGLRGDPDYAYFPSEKTNPSYNRSKTFLIDADLDGIQILGGFQGISRSGGGETDPADRNPWLYVTRLSGDLNNDDDPETFGNYGENVHHVVTMEEVESATILDGFEISGGNGFEWNDGGGGGHPFPVATHGGGVHLINSSTTTGPQLLQLVVRDNQAAIGGGGVYASSPAFEVRHCRFLNNRIYVPGVGEGAPEGGGGLQCGDVTLANCEFLGNGLEIAPSIADGGGAQVAGEIVVFNCRFRDNFIHDGGGGVLPNSSGGGLSATRAEGSEIANCSFVNNRIEYFDSTQWLESGEGGGLHLPEPAEASFAVRDCTFSHNLAQRGGGMAYAGTITEETTSVPGQVVNCVFWGNRDEFSVTLAAEQCSVLQVIFDPPLEPVSMVPPGLIAQSILEGIDSDGLAIVGDCVLDEDPAFDDDDEHVEEGSPAIDPADTNCAPDTHVADDLVDFDEDNTTNEDVPWDVDRRDREQLTSVDFGAPEFYPCASDLDGSTEVDGGDLGIFLAAWGPCDFSQACYADLNWDQSVDGIDLGILLAAWGPCEGGGGGSSMMSGSSSAFGVTPADMAAALSFSSVEEMTEWLGSLSFEAMSSVLEMYLGA
jgi:hypothetical protein